MTAKIYRVRRALIQAIYEYTGAQDLETLLCSPCVLAEAPSADLAASAWQDLIDSGLLQPLPGYNGQVARLAASFRAEIANNAGAVPYRPVLYGPR